MSPNLCIIGSSHVGAVKQAEAQIMAVFSDVSLDWFALPGGAFRRGTVTNGVYSANPQNDAEAAVIAKVNGGLSRDLKPYGALWVIGHRFGLGAVLQAWLSEPSTKARTAMRDLVGDSVARIKARFGTDTRLTVSPAPYPALRVRQDGPHHEARIAAILTRDDADAICADYESAIQNALADAGCTFQPQPAHTRARAFTTDNIYLRDARDFRAPDDRTTDLRHMNAAYGAALFTDFATRHLGLTPAATPT